MTGLYGYPNNNRDFEQRMARECERVIRYLLMVRGVPVKVFRTPYREDVLESGENFHSEDVSDAASWVYGHHSGLGSKVVPKKEIHNPEYSEVNHVFDARVLVARTDFSPFDAAEAGALEGDQIYTFDDILVGDVIEPKSCPDSTNMIRWRVTKPSKVGNVHIAYRRFDVVNIAGEGF